MNHAFKLNPFAQRRVNLHAVGSHSDGYQWPHPGRFEQWMLDWGYPLLGIAGVVAVYFGAPALTVAALLGYLDAPAAVLFKLVGLH